MRKNRRAMLSSCLPLALTAQELYWSLAWKVLISTVVLKGRWRDGEVGWFSQALKGQDQFKAQGFRQYVRSAFLKRIEQKVPMQHWIQEINKLTRSFAHTYTCMCSFAHVCECSIVRRQQDNLRCCSSSTLFFGNRLFHQLGAHPIGWIGQ